MHAQLKQIIKEAFNLSLLLYFLVRDEILEGVSGGSVVRNLLVKAGDSGDLGWSPGQEDLLE